MKAWWIGISLAWLPVLAVAAGLYTYTDKDGQVHYTDRPPANTDARQMNSLPQLPTRPAGAAMPEEAPRPKVVLYGTRTCGYCKRARTYLHNRGIGFMDLDIDTNPAARSAYRQMNGQGVPIILVGDRRLDGYSETKLARVLGDAGY